MATWPPNAQRRSIVRGYLPAVLILSLACLPTNGGLVIAAERIGWLLPHETRPIVRGQEDDFGFAEEGEVDEIETDRDSFTPATTLASPGRFIVESAYSFIDNRNSFDTHSVPELVVRYGVNDWLEARVHWNYEVGGAGNDVSGAAGEDDFLTSRIERETNLTYGFKIKGTDQDGWIPQTSVLVLGSTPTSGPDPTSAFTSALISGWTLPNRWKIDTALRFSVDSVEDDGHNLWSPSIVLKVPVHEKTNIHIEYFGIWTSKKEDNSNAQYISPGVHYLLTPDWEVGVRFGVGLNDDAARSFINVGVGFRF